MIKIPPQVNTAMEILRSKGKSAFVVGGAVRDAIMGKDASDWDIATSSLPAETVDIFKDFRVIETGIKHGTVTVIIDGMSLEITTFRVDGSYSDNRHPDSVNFAESIEEDLSRRDFTVNSIAVSSDGKITDPFGGKEDIENRIIRCVGDPDRRFSEDALRMMRALRFASVLGFEIEKETSDSIGRNFRMLANVSAERIFTELTKLLCGKDAGRILLEYSDVMFFVIPELAPMKGCVQNHPRHIFDVWGHTVKAVETVSPVPEFRFAMLLHDIGKPHCKFTDEDGIDHFYGHGKAGVSIAYDILTRLKTSVKFRNHVCDLVEYHDFVPDKISKKTYRKYIGKYGASFIEELFEVRRADVSAQAECFLAESLEQNERGETVFREIIEEDSCFGLKDLAVNGNDIISEGIASGKAVGDVLDRLLDEVLSDKLKNEKPVLLARARELRRLGDK